MSRKSTRLVTKKKRAKQTCKVFELKVDKSKLSQTTLTHLKMLFIEGKWLYNHVLSQTDIRNFNTKIKSVPVKIVDEFETRTFKYISSQMKQGIRDRIFCNILSLSALKKKGHKIGKLKFKPRIFSIPLKQHNCTFTLQKDRSSIKLQGVKQRLLVYGFNQIPEDADIANSCFVHRNNNYYFYVTCYVDKIDKKIPDTSIGIDFGCQTQLTLSNGIKIEYDVPVSKRVKRLDRKIMKKRRKNSKNKRKDQLLRAKVYEKLNNKKKDIKNKIVHAITSNYKYVCFQDESIHAWHAGRHGKKIQNTAIGGIISVLKHKAHTPIQVDKFFPSTQLCPECNNKRKLSLDERTYVCYECGYSEDRDVKSAICIEKEGLSQNKIPVDGRKFKLQDTEASVLEFHNMLSHIHGIKSKSLWLSEETPPVLTVGSTSSIIIPNNTQLTVFKKSRGIVE